MTAATPRLSTTLSLSPPKHSFSSSQAPSLNLTLTSHHSEPITIYADNLSPSLMLTSSALTITDLSTGQEVPQLKRTHCVIPPPSKVTVPLRKDLFYTLFPNTPVTFSAPFTRIRPGTGGKPLAASDPEYGSDPTAKRGACGVDGLEPGSRYILTLAANPRVRWDVIRWWEYGTKEQVLYGGSASDEPVLNGRDVRFGNGPHEPIVVDLANVDYVTFECQE
ncbi:hypothetical protein FQN53_008548 [Emmonsiellopsis sp. PD_33]|nr:hypothetical protein FQN53_008548 [Emmonsiellopsis sp. PD_33]